MSLKIGLDLALERNKCSYLEKYEITQRESMIHNKLLECYAEQISGVINAKVKKICNG